MLELIQRDPKRALEMAVPFEWRRALPETVSRYFEEQVDGRGDLDVAMAEGPPATKPAVYRQARIGQRRFEAFVYGGRLAQSCQADIPIHGIALDGKLAMAEEPVRFLTAAEARSAPTGTTAATAPVCAVCGRDASGPDALAGDVGGELMYFCGVEHGDIVNGYWADQETFGLKSLKGFNAWSIGPKELLYMRVNFPDDLTEPVSEAGAYAAMDGVNDFYVENSYDLTSVTAMVTPLLTLPMPKAWYITAGPYGVLEDARAAAFEAGYDADAYDLQIVCLTSVPGFDWAGLGMVGGPVTWLQSPGVGVTAHELGHNYGVMHANFWDTSTNNNSGIGLGWSVEYGNIYDTMGAANAGKYQFNSYFKHALLWLPDAGIIRVATNGLYRIYAYDLDNRLPEQVYALTLPRDYARDYWLEFRQRFTTDPWLQNGLLLNWSPWSESSGGTDLIDTTPGSPAQSSSREDAALTIGRTFNDIPAGLHITPLARGAEGTNLWMDVRVERGWFLENQPPSLEIEIDPPSPTPGALVHFHAAAIDPDADDLAYAWWIDGSDFSTNNLPWTYATWPAPGDHVVRCVVSDMKGGLASANAVVTVGSSIGNRIAGRIIDTNGVPIEGVRVDNLADTNAPQSVTAYTGSDGRFVIVGVSSDINLSASKYGFTFTNLTWLNPIGTGADFLQADFVATPLPVITILAASNSVTENSTATNYFIIHRTGSTETNLLVDLYLSGSALLDRDYWLEPALAVGTNTIEFPPGAEAIEIALAAINDSLLEGPEKVLLTLRDGTEYVVGGPGEADITIVDDENWLGPRISLSATHSFVPETGTDPVELVFERSGDTKGDVLIYYGVAGTAAAGVDYRTPPGVVLIPSGHNSATVRFLPIDDKEVEDDETVVVNVVANPAYGILNGTAHVVILDDDTLTVTISATQDSAAEPSSPGRFTVKRDGDLSGNLVVYYEVSGTATSGLDYAPLSGSVTIPAGSASADILVQPRDDALTEGDETVTITLMANGCYDAGTPSSATLTLLDNEKTFVTIQASDSDASEPGEDWGAFVISRGSATGGPLTVYLAISGTAANGIDYIPLDNTVTIPNGAREITVEVIPFDDLHAEPTEDVQLVLLPSTNYNLGTPMQARVLIQDDDWWTPAVGFVFSASSAPESQSPGIGLTLSSTSSAPVTVFYKVIGGTASPADYTLPPGPLTIEAGYIAARLPLQIKNNSTPQPDRTIRLALYDPVGATLDGIKIHTYTILDDDTARLSIAATVPDAFESGQTPGRFRITRQGDTTADLPVRLEVTGSAGPSVDYVPLPNPAVIPAGQTVLDLPVIPADDHTVEYPETVTVRLVSAPGATIVSPNLATVTISDNDSNTLPVVTVTSTNHPNAIEAGEAGEFVVHCSSSQGQLTVFFTVTGTATSGLDYQALPESVTFTDGQDSIPLPVIAIDDTQIEVEESVKLALTSSEAYRVLYPSSAMVLVQDNDQRVRIDASDFIAAEPGDENPGEFTFTRFGTTNGDLRVYFTISGTAGNGIDYDAISNSVVIPAGHLSAVLPIRALDDTLVEGPETVTLTLQAAGPYSVDSPSQATATIVDDEPMLTLTATVPTVVEGSQTPGIFTLKRTGDPKYEFTAYLSVGGSATWGLDYPPFPTEVHFACGVTEIDLQVFAVNELQVEGPETVNATILPDPAYRILSPSNAVITIEDAGLNQAPVVTILRPKSPTVYLHGPDVTLLVQADVVDDGGTNNLTNTWSRVSGPDAVIFGDTNAPNTTINFTNAGIYVVRLTAGDGQLQSWAELNVVVTSDELLPDTLLYWTFDDGTGTTVTDSSGDNHDGVLIGHPVWITNGVSGGAIEFPGGDDYVRALNATNLLEGRDAFSLALWFNSALTNGDQTLFCADSQATNSTLAIYTRQYATCGQASNVIEAIIRTTAGDVCYVSSPDARTNGWQHLILTWSSGDGPNLYINGLPDRPLSRYTALAGKLSGCPEFLIGKGPPVAPFSLRAQVDEVLLFPKALTDAEAGGVTGGSCSGSCTNINFGPDVNAGPDVTVQLTLPVELDGTVTDDGRPDPPAAVSNAWVLVSGPPEVSVTITNINALTNTIEFTVPGVYVFRLLADDFDVITCDDVTVTVTEPTRVDIYTMDYDGAELGPDPAEFMLFRQGDLNYDLTVFLAFGGIATNGIDFVAITNAFTFTNQADYLSIPIVPYLDHRTEGDQDLTLTIVSNLAYTIGNGQATVVIHDSPYGVWTIEHFTLEELTDPKLSGETADFDEDGFINFAEYAANTDPKSPETNAPVLTSIQTDPTDGLPHVVLTYHRRLNPTDVAYAACVSNDLLLWNTGDDYIEELQATDDGNGISETVTARVKAPLSDSGNLFITVRVWLLATEPP